MNATRCIPGAFVTNIRTLGIRNKDNWGHTMFEKLKDQKNKVLQPAKLREDDPLPGPAAGRAWPASTANGADPAVSANPDPEQTKSGLSPLARESQSRQAMALIGPSIVIDGTVSGEENLTIAGTVKGQINLRTNDLVVVNSGHVDADINASVVRIDGEVNGNIRGVDKVVISSRGRVNGNIVAPRVILEDGALFKGNIDMDPGERVRKPTALPKAAGKAESAEVHVAQPGDSKQA
jgi:cytoskeletal protein CcmA (bactofilin family)